MIEEKIMLEYVILQHIQVRSGDIVPFLFKILIFP